LDRNNFNKAQPHARPFECLVLHEKVGVKDTPSTKVELSHNKIARVQGLDELARLLFPQNRNHQKVFLAVFVELKYAPGQFLAALSPLCRDYGFSHRMLETVRGKMRRLGIIDHVCRFNKSHGYREGWVFSTRFSHGLVRLAELSRDLKDKRDGSQEQKDRDLFMYI
jgi:hypothetical protein